MKQRTEKSNYVECYLYLLKYPKQQEKWEFYLPEPNEK